MPRPDPNTQTHQPQLDGLRAVAVLAVAVLGGWPRGEKVAHKDVKLRTFISQEKNRMQMASHVYDITYGVVQPTDHLVCIDDSIVRGTTLRRSAKNSPSSSRMSCSSSAAPAPSTR